MNRASVVPLILALAGCGANVDVDTESSPFSILGIDLGGTADTWIAGRCLDETLPLDGDGQPECTVVVEHRDGICDCNGPWEVPPSPENAHLRALVAPLFEDSCLCEIPRLTGEALVACQHSDNMDEAVANGFCYVEKPNTPTMSCLSEDQAMVRYYGKGPVAHSPNRIALICRVEP
ncbi:hypothetical protein KEG57_23220 [Polyangium jinanense]|uniref:Lipoprotein n=2 Tax=Polyangium jinanense TaxID=2829994 RepID=A0A9X3X396_9BACT|nr:hypothetical protein [Polyangium jinanense]